MSFRFALLLPVALLAACDRKSHQASVEISSENGSTSVSATPGKDGRLRIDTPGMKADINVPFLAMATDKMEIDGVKLFPGSKIAGVNINAEGAKDDGRFALKFNAPAGRDKVAAWFQQQFTENDFKMTLRGTQFSGTNDDGNPVVLDMRDGPAGSTEGEIRIGSK